MLLRNFTPLYAPAAPCCAAHVFAFAGDALFLTESGTLPDAAMLRDMPPPDADSLIGELDGQPCRLLAWPVNVEPPQGLSLHNLRQAWGQINDTLFAIASRARMLADWDRQHRFCGACGAPTEPAADEAVRSCPRCGLNARPRLSPAIMVLVQRGDEVLLARSPHFRLGMYTALAGFVEPGESLEGCVHREVQEEVGLQIRNLRWFGSQSWAFPNSLMLAFHADYAGGELVLQPGEIEDARWFRKGEQPQEWPHPGSISYRLIRSALG